MGSLLTFLPVPAAALFAWAFQRFNRRRKWFTVGELIFWDIVVLVVLQLVWLIWF
ncbi:hypothetical protein RB623_14775 [Mesorhizobium sp. LHD-90]|uniref:hypothetical protein n=1 Tax=Mesorhizobium sp. LHD-90 TaxID=3071414 RepID=UPI0027E148DA|nr:hypothetical protein [Mesorhizobium sp. LHD-90]MDQ6435320.1 hypothetical protein [Mesorhizobium sp. LHD-90]